MKIFLLVLSGIVYFVCTKAYGDHIREQSRLPKRELGIGLGTIYLPDYFGSDEYRLYAAPFPYIIYRGKILQMDDEGFRGQLIKSPQFELNIGFAFSPPSLSNKARSGMPKLEPVFELGPEMKWETHHSGRHLVNIYFPIRAALSTDRKKPTDITLRGWVADLSLRYEYLVSENHGDFITFLIGGGPSVATEKYADYYFSVKPAHANAERQEFDAVAGPLSVGGFVAIKGEHGPYWYSVFSRYESLLTNPNRKSPLIKSMHYSASGFAMAWIFDQTMSNP